MANTSEQKVREMRDRIEDTFLDLAEKGIQSGLSFEKAMEKNPEYISEYGVWKDKYETWQRFAPRPEYFSLAAERQAVKIRREQEAQAATEEGFYQSNKQMLTELAEAKNSFEATGLTEDLRPFYQRAYAEVWGRNAEMPQGDPVRDMFLAGFKYD